MKFFLIALLLFVDWPATGGPTHDYRLDATAEDLKSLEDAKLVCATRCHKTNSGVVLSANQVCIFQRLNEDQEPVVALQLTNGKPLWNYQYHAPIPKSAAIETQARKSRDAARSHHQARGLLVGVRQRHSCWAG